VSLAAYRSLPDTASSLPSASPDRHPPTPQIPQTNTIQLSERLLCTSFIEAAVSIPTNRAGEGRGRTYRPNGDRPLLYHPREDIRHMARASTVVVLDVDAPCPSGSCREKPGEERERGRRCPTERQVWEGRKRGERGRLPSIERFVRWRKDIVAGR
jgi:hypothetical protein